jgi:hypothetical protein
MPDNIETIEGVVVEIAPEPVVTIVNTPSGSLMFKYPHPKSFDGGKFAARYGLKRGEFWSENGEIHCVKELPENLIFENPDPIIDAREPLKTKIDAALASALVPDQIKDILIEWKKLL